MIEKNKTKWIGLFVFVMSLVVANFVYVGWAQAKSIAINKKNFPEKEIRSTVRSESNGRRDKITQKELKEVTLLEIDAGKRKINFKGVEHLSHLFRVDVTEWTKVVKLPKIKTLLELDYCNHAMRRLTLRRFPRLESVNIIGKQLTELDLSKNCQIKSLRLDTSKLAAFDFSKFNKLESLSLVKHKFKQLDLSCNKKIRWLYLENVKDAAPDLKSLTQLENLTIKNCDIETLDLTGLSKLKELSIYNCRNLQRVQLQQCNRLKILCIRNSQNLQEITADNSAQLKELEISKCGKVTNLDSFNLLKLKRLTITNTSVTNLSASRFPKLKYLTFIKNAQPVIDFQVLKNLVYLVGGYESTTRVLDVSMLPDLYGLSWTNGVVERVKFGKKSRFDQIYLLNNRLSGKWDLSKFTKLGTFDCSNNKITALYLEDLDQSLSLCCRNNRLKKIDARYCETIGEFDCRGNRGVKVYMHPSLKQNDDIWLFGKTANVYYQYG